tara:strand:- start:484 stop:1554 length:1071 start_codon:yes stop_codon:yes gene_type:complete
MKKLLLDILEDNIVNEAELIQTLIATGKEDLEFEIPEGPDLKCLRLMDKPFLPTLEHLLSTLGNTKEKIYFTTHNWIQDQSVWPNIQRRSVGPWFADTEKYFSEMDDKDFTKHFGFFINSSRWHRLYIGTFLHRNYNQKTMMSYRQSHFHAGSHADLQFDTLMMKLGESKNPQIYNQLSDFFNALPINLEGQFPNDNLGGAGNYLKLCNWDNQPVPYELTPMYAKFFVDIVAETWHSGRCFMPTEKTVRPIMTKNPFIAYGPQGYLRNLRKMGFKTFNRWWSEEYDEWPEVQRINLMFDVMKLIAEKSLDELKSMYKEMTPVLEHNQNILKTLSNALANERVGSIFDFAKNIANQK